MSENTKLIFAGLVIIFVLGSMLVWLANDNVHARQRCLQEHSVEVCNNSLR